MVSSGLDKKFGGPPEAVTGAACALQKLGIETSVAVFGQTRESWNRSHFRETLEANSVKSQLFSKSYTSKYGGLPNLRDFSILWKMISQSDFITLHQVFNFQNIICTLIIRYQKKPFALMPHGSMTTYQTKKNRFRKFLVYPIFIKGIVNNVDSIFVATENEKNEIPSKWRTKTKIVGLGITTKRSIFKQKRQKHGLFTFIFMGRLTHKKRIDVALSSLKLACELTSIPIRLIVCGSGDQSIVSLVREYQKSSSLLIVDYRGWVSGAEKEDLLRLADCFILTSEDENFAIAVAEGLSFGLPALISNKVALSSLVARYYAGGVFNELNIETIAFEAIKIMNSNLLQLSENALIASRELTWDQVIKTWKSAIQSMLAHR